MKKIAVVGSGIAGLSAARLLEKQGHEVTVFEAAPRAGGRIWSEDFAGDPLEWGPNTLLASHEKFSELTELAGVTDKIKLSDETAKSRFVWRYGKIQRLPMGLKSALKSPLLGVGALMRVLLEPLVYDAEQIISVDDFFTYRLGSKIADNFVDPFVSGIYSGDSRLLSAKHAFPKIRGFVDDHGSILAGGIHRIRQRKKQKNLLKGLASFEGGMDTLTRGLEKDLALPVQVNKKLMAYEEDEESVKLVFEDGEESSFDQMVLAVVPSALSRLVRKDCVSFSSVLQQSPCPPIAVVHLRGADLKLKPEHKGFGLLFGRHEPVNEALGILFVSEFFKRKDGQTHLCVFLGGRRFPQIANWDEEKCQKVALKSIRKTLNIKGEPEEMRAKLMNPGLPQYESHMDTVNTFKKRFHESHPRIRLVGTWSGGISVLDGYHNTVKTLNGWT